MKISAVVFGQQKSTNPFTLHLHGLSLHYTRSNINDYIKISQAKPLKSSGDGVFAAYRWAAPVKDNWHYLQNNLLHKPVNLKMS